MPLNESFNQVAELYDRARPRYPDALYTDLRALTGLGPGAKVLEIAPATGIATVPLAKLGFDVTAVEMGESLAAVARRNLASFPNARVEVSRFEDWVAPAEPFDLVCCATAFSWLDPSVRLTKCAMALRRGGYLAVWDTLHVEGGTSQFFVDVQECYERWMPGTEPSLRLPGIYQASPARYGFDAHPSFELVATRDYALELEYTTESYLEVIQTYSGHIALEPANAAGLYECIASLLDSRYGGRIRKAYLFHLNLARRR